MPWLLYYASTPFVGSRLWCCYGATKDSFRKKMPTIKSAVIGCDTALTHPEGRNLNCPHCAVLSREKSYTKPNSVTPSPFDESHKNRYKMPCTATGEFTLTISPDCSCLVI